jgi:hypothetical protein
MTITDETKNRSFPNNPDCPGVRRLQFTFCRERQPDAIPHPYLFSTAEQ